MARGCSAPRARGRAMAWARARAAMARGCSAPRARGTAMAQASARARERAPERMIMIMTTVIRMKIIFMFIMRIIM